MNITVNEKTASRIYSDADFYQEVRVYLNSVIDEEIEKGDDMDTELIDECVNALDELDSNEISPAADLNSSEEKTVRFCRKKTSDTTANLQRAAAASIILILTGTAAMKANPALAQQAKDLLSYIAEALGIAADSTLEDGSQVKALYGELDDDIRLTVRDEDDIDLNAIKVIALYENNAQEEIPIEKCEITTTREDGHIILIISYDGCAFSISYTLEG